MTTTATPPRPPGRWALRSALVLATLALGMFWGPGALAQSDLIITGVIDGPLPGGEPKALELYVVNDIADLSEYGVGSANNGGGSDGVEGVFPAVPVPAGTFLYVANDREPFVEWFGFEPTFEVGAANINGDDAIELFRRDGGTDAAPTFAVVDVFGEITYDASPSSLPWSYEDGWAYRQDGTGPDGSTFEIDNFRFSGRNALDDDADGTNATATPPFPVGSYMRMAAPVGTPGELVVTTADDELNADGDCSLREAVQAANTNAAVDRCAAGLADGDEITFESAFTITLSLGELLLTDDVSIDASDVGTVTIDGAGDSRIFDVDAAGGAGSAQGVAFTSLALRNGDSRANSSAPDAGGAVDLKAGSAATFTDVDVTDSVAGVNGGGIHGAGGATVVVTTTDGGSSTISGNEAQGAMAGMGGGGVWNAGSTTISGDVTVSGNAATGTAGSGGGVFNSGGTLSIDGATISGNTANRAGGGIEDAGGTVVLTGVSVTGNSIATAAPGNGGGLHSGGGDVTVNGGLFEDNTAVEGGGLWSNGTLAIGSDDGGPTRITGNTATGAAADNGGGGLYAETGATVTVTGAAIDGNLATGASGSGGGLFVADGASISMTLGNVSGNEANRAGGGAEVATGGTLTLSQVTVSGNSLPGANPGNGGGVHVGGTGAATVSQSTVSGNSAAQGGGLWNSGSGTLDVSNSTVSGNSATDDGGGVYTIPGGATSLESVTVALNSAGADGGGLAISVVTSTSVSVDNTIVGGNTAGGSGNDCFGQFNTNGFLLVEDRGDDCVFFGGTGNSIFGQDPELGPLADNGGPTLTHALGEDSPAVDAGQSAFAVDQRGEPREDNQDDLGAFESADDGNAVVACSTSSPLSFDADGDGSPTDVMTDDFSAVTGGSFRGATGEFAGVRNESGSVDVDLSTCSFVTFDPYSEPVEEVIYSATTTGTVEADDVYVLASNGGDQSLPADVFFDDNGAGGPGAFALIEGTATAGDPVASVFGRIVAAVVYDRNGDVFGAVGGDATEAEMQAFSQALLNAFSGVAVSTDGTAEVDLAVAAWPNPTRGASTVAFGLAEGGAAQVAVYDVLGREVAVAADRVFGPGRHEVSLPQLAAGAYVVRVASEGGVRTVRLTVAR